MEGQYLGKRQLYHNMILLKAVNHNLITTIITHKSKDQQYRCIVPNLDIAALYCNLERNENCFQLYHTAKHRHFGYIHYLGINDMISYIL